MDKSKRQFLKASLLGIGAVSLSLTAWSREHEGVRLAVLPEPMGKLQPVKDETTGLALLKLPEGFRYHTFSWAGTQMDDGLLVPASADGMGVIAQSGPIVTLVRNHELRGSSGAIGPTEYSYDVTGGGTTNLIFDTQKEALVDARVSLSGTLNNCAGGVTPWGTWLSCEEAPWSPTAKKHGPTPRQGAWRLENAQQEHGFVFEVDAGGIKYPEPIGDMGQFYHEAVAFDRDTGIAYLTEDAAPAAGFYRFLSATEGQLSAGGKLQIMRVEDGWDMRKIYPPGIPWKVGWVDIEDPQQGINPKNGEGDAVVRRGSAAGGSTFASLEGCIADHFAQETRIYFTAKAGGKANAGRVFDYDPTTETLRLLLDSPGHDTLSGPDNITVSPRGSLVICEDRITSESRAQSLFGLTGQGQLFRFCQINPLVSGQHVGFRLSRTLLNSEWAGVTFSKDGQWLFCNIYKPGLSVAITGPWQEGLI